MNAISPILQFGKTRREVPALIDGGRTITYGELAVLVRRTAGHLAAVGISRGQRIGLCLKDTADHVVALLALAYMGAVAVPLDWRARPAENARFIDGLGIARVLAEQDARLANDGRAIVCDAGWRGAVADATDSGGPAADWCDPFAISATSGSTGAPKFTLMTHLEYHFAIAGMFELMALAGHHRFLCTMPLYYSGGRNSCLMHLLRGDCVVLYPGLFTAVEYVDVIDRNRITVAGGPPSLVRQLLAAAGDEALLPRLAMFFSTGAPLQAEEKRRAARKLTPHFHERYGAAETLAISILRPADLDERGESVGQPHSLAEIEVVDESDRTLPSGAVGRLRYRGPGLGSPLNAETAAANYRHGWYYPGEIASLDEAGYIYLQGRTAEVIIRHGAKIYPAEVERTLLEHPGVMEAAVMGQREADDDEAVIAFVVTREMLPAGELIAWCRTRLTPHKAPKRIHLLDHLPKNTAGKVDKSALAGMLAGERPDKRC